MQYLLLIYENEKRWREGLRRSRAEGVRRLRRGVPEAIAGGNALQPTRTATTVRVREGKRLTTDGPFAETKEQLGGYYLVEAKDLDEALAHRRQDSGRAVSARSRCARSR